MCLTALIGCLDLATCKQMEYFHEGLAGKSGYARIEPGVVAFGRYKIEKLLGSGASGAVYKACDLSIANLPVALKVFPRQVAQDELSISRINREIEVAYSIKHQNVIRLFECVRDEYFFGFSMEYVEGESLHSILAREGPLPFKKIAHYAYQIAAGLSAIHEKGVVHRDIKLENIVITKEGLAKIADFGVAGFSKNLDLEQVLEPEIPQVNPSQMRRDSMSHDVVGTIDYIAPEYIEHGVYDHRADIYALGVIIYELISGRAPFEGASIPQLVAMKVQMDPKWVVLFRKDCPNELDLICHHALARAPERRYANCSEIKADLQKFINLMHSSQQLSAIENPRTSQMLSISSTPKSLAKLLNAGRDLALILLAAGALMYIAEKFNS